MAEPIQGTQNVDTLYGTVNNDKLLGHQGDDIFDLTQSTAPTPPTGRAAWIPLHLPAVFRITPSP